MRIDNLLDFDFLSPLPERNVQAALMELERLAALNPLTGALSDPLGLRMAQLPLDPIWDIFLESLRTQLPTRGSSPCSDAHNPKPK